MRNKLIMVLLCSVMILTTGCNKQEYYCCPDGYLLKEGKCEKTEYHTLEIIYTCPDGYIARTDGMCYLDGKRYMFATPTYKCINGGTKNGKTCVSTKVQKPYVCSKDKYDEFVKKQEKHINGFAINNYIGVDYNVAKSALEEDGLQVVIEKKDIECAEYLVCGQSIKEGEIVNVNDVVVLYISNKYYDKYPDFSNYTLEDVKDFVNKYNLILKISYEESEYDSGKIIYQSRQSESKIISNSILEIIVAK